VKAEHGMTRVIQCSGICGIDTSLSLPPVIPGIQSWI
jgi:hypothetical protein